MSEELRVAINTIGVIIDNMKCEDLHHFKKWRHEVGYICPAEYHIQRQWYLIKEYLNKVVDSELE